MDKLFSRRSYNKFFFYYCLFLVVLLPFPILSQTINTINVVEKPDGVEIDIVSTAESFVTNINGKNHFNYSSSMDESSPGKPILPSQTYIIAIPPLSKVNVELSDKQENYIQNAHLNINPKIIAETDTSFTYKQVEMAPKYFTGDYFPLEEIEVLDYFWIRDFYCVSIKVNPIRYNWKEKSLKNITTAKLIVNFVDQVPFEKNSTQLNVFEKELKNIIVNFSSALEFRSLRKLDHYQNSLSDWIDYSKNYYKLAIIRDGTYRISYNNLVSYGIAPSLINPKTIKVFSKGKQLPLFVKGEDDLAFNQNDYIEFYAERNYGSSRYRDIVDTGEDYLNYLDRYSDTAFVWLSYDGEDGLRIPTQNLQNVVTSDTIKSYLNRQHFERDIRLWYHSTNEVRTQLPFWQEHKVFSWLLSSNSGSNSITFFAPDFVPNTKVKTLTRLISNQWDTLVTVHRHGASLNSSTPQDTIIYSIQRTANFFSDFSTNQLTDTSNVFRVFGLSTSGGAHRSLIDWVDIEYYRKNLARNDSITIVIPDSVVTGVRNIRISNINTPDTLISIYKINKSIKRFTSFNLINGELVFIDTVSGGDKYIVSKQSYFRTPIFRYSRGFTNLRDPSRGADYILLTHKSLNQSTQEYMDFIEANYNLRFERVFVEDVYDEFGFGQNWAESIKDFLVFTKNNWTSPAPSYVNIVGDANYDYKNVWNPAPTPRKKNLVPSYGFPVSDQWYTTLDSTNLNIPQLFISRIPANSDSEVRAYLSKYKTYLIRRYDEWNKRFLLFSGGDPTKPTELTTIKSANDQVLNNIILPPPISGNAINFYKTLNPPTNFGPFSNDLTENWIDSSGLFINYIGHSGTRTWDNGITEVEDLKSTFPDRYQLISDFGCSTGKFSEPDVNAFGELFIAQSPKGDAITYLGNSSLGFLSTSVTFPRIFYRNLLTDSVNSIIKSHIRSKLEMLNSSGYSDPSRVFNYCNLSFGDPLIELAVPDKPNYVVNQSSVFLKKQIPDLEDSIKVTLSVYNWGKAIQDSIFIIVTNSFEDSITYTDTIKIKSPELVSNLDILIKSEGLVGIHYLKVIIDPQNFIEEMYEDDNEAEYIYSIYSTKLRPITEDFQYVLSKDTLKILNPTVQSDNKANSFILSVSTDPEFVNASDYQFGLDTIVTKINFNLASTNDRLWYRTRLNIPEIKWSAHYSYRNMIGDYNFFIDKSYSSEDIFNQYTAFDSSDFSWKLVEVSNNLRLISAGSNDGKFASIIYNNSEKLPNTFFWGIATAEIDTITYRPYNINYFAWPNTLAQNSDSLTRYINSLPSGKWLALTICDDAAQTVLGFGGGTPVRRAIESLGSYYIDSVRYRESWSMIGIKGAPTGSVPESYKKLFKGFATVDTTREFFPDSGYLVFPPIMLSSKWQSVTLDYTLPQGSNLDLIPLGLRGIGIVDTLTKRNLFNNIASLDDIDASIYPEIKFWLKLKSNELKQTPMVKSIGVNLIGPPELGTNYQVVGVDKDTIPAGGNINLTFWVYNVGEAKADSFTIKVDVLNSNNTLDTSYSYNAVSIPSESRRKFIINYSPSGFDSEKKFVINIDPENKIREYFEDNNFFTKSFFIQSDIIPPSIKITFDEMEVVNGDFVSDRPNIKIALSDESPIPIIDTSAIKIYLNEDPVYYGANPNILSYSINSSNPKFVAEYKPELEDGDYLLRVVGKDPNGNVADSASSEVYFVVSSETRLHQVYNYPNPFSNETYFTFRLSQIPQEIKIRIYTIAGRMIKEIIRNSSELNFDLNRIYWDGKDEDGDIIANGTYLYKVFIKHDDKVESVTQKLVIVK